MTMNNNLLAKLISRQRQARFTDQCFAGKLGIARSLWTETRNGTRPIGLALLKGAYNLYPELGCDILLFIKDGREK